MTGNYIKKKRNRVDRCNICGKLTQLTWDHVPPKSVLIEPSTYVNTVFGDIPSINQYMTHYQSGIKYRSICANCNNVILGRNDKEYSLFLKTVSDRLVERAEAISRGFILPPVVYVECKINRVLRAVCGHFLAMKSEYDDQVKTDKVLREFVLDEMRTLDDLRVYTWFYPYNTIINARDFAVRGHTERTHPTGFLSVMLSYPLAFMLSHGEEREDYFKSLSIQDLGKYSSSDINKSLEIPLKLETAFSNGTNTWKEFKWPINVSDDESGAAFALGGREFMEKALMGVSSPLQKRTER